MQRAEWIFVILPDGSWARGWFRSLRARLLSALIAIDHERLRARHERRASSLLESGQLQVHDAR